MNANDTHHGLPLGRFSAIFAGITFAFRGLSGWLDGLAHLGQFLSGAAALILAILAVVKWAEGRRGRDRRIAQAESEVERLRLLLSDPGKGE